MIRINLLAEKSKGKKGKRGGPPAPVMTALPSEGPNIVLVAIICVAIGALLAYLQYNKLQKDHDKIVEDTAREQSESKRLEAVARQYDERKKEAEQYERQVKVIDNLRSNQVGPVKLLSKLSDVVNNTDAVWLNNMSENGDSISMDGVALSTIAIATLITNLNNSGYFGSVELRDATEEPGGGRWAQFSFSITCTKMQPQQQQQQPKRT